MWAPDNTAGAHIYVGGAMHPEAMEAVRVMVLASDICRRFGSFGSDKPRRRRGLDIGGADVNGSARGLIPVVDTWLSTDIAPGSGVDMVLDATKSYVLLDEQFDVVLCTEVLEHVEEWPLIVRNAWYWLAPGGVAFFTAAATDGKTWARRPHGARGELDPPAGEHYANVLVDHLDTVIRRLGHDLEPGLTAPIDGPNGGTYQIQARPNPGDVYAWIRKDRTLWTEN